LLAICRRGLACLDTSTVTCPDSVLSSMLRALGRLLSRARFPGVCPFFEGPGCCNAKRRYAAMTIVSLRRGAKFPPPIQCNKSRRGAQRSGALEPVKFGADFVLTAARSAR